MKKFIFSALACVAFVFSGFASNEVLDEELLMCTISVRLVDDEGNTVTDIKHDSRKVKSNNECLDRATKIVESLEAEGYNIGVVYVGM